MCAPDCRMCEWCQPPATEAEISAFAASVRSGKTHTPNPPRRVRKPASVNGKAE